MSEPLKVYHVQGKGMATAALVPQMANWGVGHAYYDAKLQVTIIRCPKSVADTLRGKYNIASVVEQDAPGASSGDAVSDNIARAY